MGKDQTIRGAGRLRRYGLPGRFLSDRIIDRNLAHRRESVMMLHVGRVGSTVLGRMLDRHSHVAWPGEIFYRTPARHTSERRTPSEIRQLIRERAGQSAADVFGFEVKHAPTQDLSPAVTNLDFPTLLSLFRDFGGRKIIHLRRRNIVRRCVSAELARGRRTYHVKEQAGELPRIELPLRDQVFGYGRFDLIDVLDRCDARTPERVEGFDLLSLVYEDDIERDPGVAFTKICDFLGLPEEDCVPDLKKIDPRPIQEIFVNFDEVERYLEKTPYHQHLFE